MEKEGKISLMDKAESVVRELLEHPDIKIKEKGARLALTLSKLREPLNDVPLSPAMQVIFNHEHNKEQSAEANFEIIESEDETT